MKGFAWITVLALAASSASLFAQSGHMKGMDMKDMDMKNMNGMKMDQKSASKDDKRDATHKATGVVKSSDRNKSTVTLAHGPVPSLGWPAMTMSFVVKDKAMLDKLAANKKVDIEFVQQGKDYVITGVK